MSRIIQCTMLFQDYYKEMPWAAIPYRFKDALQGSDAFSQPRGIPSLYIFNEKGTLYQTNGRSMVMNDKFPYQDPEFSELFQYVVDGDMNKVPEETLRSKKYIGLYFSAHWCGPCRMFTPKLTEFYSKFERDDFELIFCSSDRDEASFKDYFKDMSFKALNKYASDEASKFQEFLSQKAGVRGIPHLIILDIDGNIIQKNARSSVETDPEGKNFPWKTPALQDLSKTLEGINEKPSIILYCEGKSDEEKAALNTLMKEEAAKHDALKKRKCMHFISQTKSDIGERVKEITGSTRDTLMMLVIQKGEYYETGIPSSAADVAKFWEEYEAGSLTAKKLNM